MGFGGGIATVIALVQVKSSLVIIYGLGFALCFVMGLIKENGTFCFNFYCTERLYDFVD